MKISIPKTTTAQNPACGPSDLRGAQVRAALEAAYRYLTQPQVIGGGTATYLTNGYNALAEQMRQAMRQ